MVRTWKSHGTGTLRLSANEPELKVMVPDWQLIVEAGSDKSAVDVPLTRAAEATVDIALNPALNWSPASKDENEP